MFNQLIISRAQQEEVEEDYAIFQVLIKFSGEHNNYFQNYPYKAFPIKLINPKKGGVVQLPNEHHNNGTRIKIVDIGLDFYRGEQVHTVYAKEYK